MAAETTMPIKTQSEKPAAPAPMPPAVPRGHALAALDALDQQEHEAEAARQRARVDARRKAALEDARVALKAWEVFAGDLAWPRPAVAGHPECDRVLSPWFNQQVLDSMISLRNGIVETARQHIARLSAMVTELDGLNPATGAARVEQIGAVVRAEPAALASAYDSRANWYTARRKMLPEAQALVTIGHAIAAWFAVDAPAPTSAGPTPKRAA